MRKFNTQGIVLARSNYGEAARILTFLTPDNGKLKVIAKGVRKSKSKLAGGIELLSVSHIGVLEGKGDIDTLVSSRLVKHYGNIVKDLDRTRAAYQLIKNLNKATEDQPEAAYFSLMQDAFGALDDGSVSLELIEAWFGAQLLKLSGRAPNLQTEKSGSKLMADKKYDFNYESMCFEPGKNYTAADIKMLRLLFSSTPIKTLKNIQDAQIPLKVSSGLIADLSAD